MKNILLVFKYTINF